MSQLTSEFLDVFGHSAYRAGKASERILMRYRWLVAGNIDQRTIPRTISYPRDDVTPESCDGTTPRIEPGTQSRGERSVTPTDRRVDKSSAAERVPAGSGKNLSLRIVPTNKKARVAPTRGGAAPPAPPSAQKPKNIEMKMSVAGRQWGLCCYTHWRDRKRSVLDLIRPGRAIRERTRRRCGLGPSVQLACVIVDGAFASSGDVAPVKARPPPAAALRAAGAPSRKLYRCHFFERPPPAPLAPPPPHHLAPPPLSLTQPRYAILIFDEEAVVSAGASTGVVAGFVFYPPGFIIDGIDPPDPTGRVDASDTGHREGEIEKKSARAPEKKKVTRN
ncbi:unnamed protein product, partial [Iphiclides podalirius]